MPAPSTKPISKEYRIYLAIWRKAWLDKSEVRFKCSNRTMAIAIRQGMYRAIRPFRNGLMNDDELKKACEKYVVYMEPTDDPSEPCYLVMKERMTLHELEDMVTTFLGIDDEDLLLMDERTIHAKLEHLLSDDEGDKPKKANPFFTRED